MQCSTALREMKNNPKYYSNLLEYVNKVQCASEFQISLDLKRTFPDDKRCMKPEFLQKLKNILLCYSIRNSTIGYCQGMNFIVGRLLLIVDNEVKITSFHLLYFRKKPFGYFFKSLSTFFH